MSARRGRAVETKIQTKRLMLRIAIQAKGRLNEQSLACSSKRESPLRRANAGSSPAPKDFRSKCSSCATTTSRRPSRWASPTWVSSARTRWPKRDTTSNRRCRSDSAPAASRWPSPTRPTTRAPDYFRGRRVATSYPNILRDISRGRASKPRSTPSRDRWRSHRP